MTASRTKNTKRNIIFSFLDTFLTMGFQFVSRSIIVYVFSDQYLGLSSLFSSILQVLNMADLGFSIAIVYNMYKPIAENDVEKVCALLNYYKRIYRIVGVIVLSVGLALIPAIPHLIKGECPQDINIYIVYLFYIANTVISYFLFAYKTALLNALQRLDLTKIAYSLVSIIQYACQIVSLLVFKNFYLYMACMVLGTAARNVVCAYVSEKFFPQYECKGEVSERTKKDIISRVKGLLISNISGVTYTTFDSIILSAFIGLSAVAIYNNYIVIFHGLMNFVVLIRSAMQASVGNSVALESKEKNYQDMLLWQFLFSIIASWCASCLLSLYQPFMTIWMGADRLLPMRDVIMLCFWFFFSVVSNAFFLYLSGNGLWWEMRWPYILSTVCNLLLNVILGKIWGVSGIIFSTVFSSVIFGMIWQCLIVFRVYYEGKSAKEYFSRQVFLLLTGILGSVVAYLINGLLPVDGVIGIVLKGIICSIVVLLVYVLFYWKTEAFRTAIGFIKRAIKI